MNDIQLVIPMAGKGSRFASAGYTVLKPLIPVHGIPMISLVVANLVSTRVSHLVLVCQRETMEAIDLAAALGHLECRLSIVAVDEVTDGPATTVGAAYPVLNLDKPLVIANSDQYVAADLNSFYSELVGGKVAGAVLCMTDNDPKWSYAELDGEGFVKRVVEKEVISSHATVGIYGFAQARLAFDAFAEMKAAKDLTNGEYYVAPSYNYLVKHGKKISITDLGIVSSVMFGLGIPEDLEAFLDADISKTAVERAKISLCI